MRDGPESTALSSRLALAEHILTLWYPRTQSAWLKAAPLDRILDPSLRAALAAAGDDPHAQRTVQREIVEHFLDHEFGRVTPEDSRYGEFTDAVWRPVTGDELRRCIDLLFDEAAAQIAQILDEEAAERAEAEAGDYLHTLRPSALDGLMTDLPTLRKWFTTALWGRAEPTWWTMAPDEYGPSAPAVIGLDDELVAILWLC